jgi:hypothetical protein
MTLLLDNIIASIIMATILLALAATQLRVQEAGISQVSSHSAKNKALSFGQWLDEDIVSLGENVIDKSARFGNPDTSSYRVYTIDDGGTRQPRTITYTTEWRFYSDRLAGGGKQRVATRYKLIEQPDSLEVELRDGSTYSRPLFQLERSVSGWKNVNPITDTATFTDADFTEDGRSVSTLSLFHIQLVDNQGIPFAAANPLAPDQASFIRVDFTMVPEFELKRGYLRELYWTTTLKVRPFWG